MLSWLFHTAQLSYCNKDMGNTQVQPPEQPLCAMGSPGYEGMLVVQLYLMPAFFIGVLIFGLPLNLLSLWIFSHRLKRWTRSTVLLFNLTLADTSWLLALPILVQYHLDQLYWSLGLPLCKAVRLFYHNYFYLSIFFVSAVSVDRYLAIVHPLRFPALVGRRQTYMLCVMAWVVNMALSIPEATMTLTQQCPGNNRTICTLYVLLEKTGETLPYSLCCSVVGFLFPLVAISYCCRRSVRELCHRTCLPHPHNRGRRLIRVLKAVLILFALLYLPYHLVRNAAIIMRVVYPDSPASWVPVDLAFTVEMCLCSLNSCINPLFSCFVGRQFRREFHDTFVVLFSHCAGVEPASVLPKQQRRAVGHGMATITPL